MGVQQVTSVRRLWAQEAGLISRQTMDPTTQMPIAVTACGIVAQLLIRPFKAVVGQIRATQVANALRVLYTVCDFLEHSISLFGQICEFQSPFLNVSGSRDIHNSKVFEIKHC
jgi:hypothetical protein